MRFCSSHQGGIDKDFGLWPSRLIYKGETLGAVEKDVSQNPRGIEDVKREKEEWEKAKAAFFDKETTGKLRGDVIEEMEDYNNFISRWRLDPKLFAEWKLKVWDMSLTAKPRLGARMHPNWLLRQSTEDIAELRSEIKDKKSKIDPHPDVKEGFKEDMKELLEDLLKALDKYETHIKKIEKKYKDIIQRHGEYLTGKGDLAEAQLNDLDAIKRTPLYDRLEGSFNAVLTTVKDKNPAFRGFWESPENAHSASRDRQMKQLFFSILGEATNGFTDAVDAGCVIGKEFLDKPERNKRKFPFLYNEWLKKEVDEGVLNGISDLKTKVESAQTEAAAVKSVDEIVAEDLVPITNLGGKPIAQPIDDIKYRSLKSPAEPASSDNLLDYHDERLEAVNNLMRQYGRLSKDKSFDEKRRERFGQKAEKMEKHVQLEKTYKAYYEAKRLEEEAAGRFTRAELTKESNEQWLIGVLMRKFQKAVEIVDGKNGETQFAYHPAVRRMLIAMVYREGVARSWTEDGIEKYDDDVADEFKSMLSQLALSPAFNIDLKGKFHLTPETKTYMLLARFSNLIQLRLPVKRAQVEKLRQKVDIIDKARLDRLGINPEKGSDSFVIRREKLQGIFIEAALKERVEKTKRTAKGVETQLPAAGVYDAIDWDNPEARRFEIETAIMNEANMAGIITPGAPEDELRQAVEWARSDAATEAGKVLARVLDYIDAHRQMKEWNSNYIPMSILEAKRQAAMDKGATILKILSPPIHPDATDPESQRAKTEAFLANIAEVHKSAAATMPLADKIALARQYAKENPGSQAEAVVIMLDYINEFSKMNESHPDYFAIRKLQSLQEQVLEPATKTLLRSIRPEPVYADARVPEGERAKTEAYLVWVAENFKSALITRTTTRKDKLGLARQYAQKSPASPAAAAVKMLDYINHSRYVESMDIARVEEDMLARLKEEVGKVADKLRMLKVDPDAQDPVTQKHATEAILIKEAKEHMSPIPGASRQELITLGVQYGAENPESNAAAAIKMLDYINQYTHAQQKASLIQEGMDYGQAKQKSDAAAALDVWQYLTESERARIWERDARLIDKHIKTLGNPKATEEERKAARDFIDVAMARENLEGRTNTARLTNFTEYSNSIEVSYNMFDLNEQSAMNYLDRMGIRTEGLYENYLEYIKKNPDMKVSDWQKYFTSNDDAEFGKLVTLLSTIIPEESQVGGKTDFLILFESLHKFPETTPENQKQRYVVMQIYKRIQIELMHREEIYAAEESKDKELRAKLKGMNVGEKITKYGGALVDMIFGPGQSWANRGAGIVLGYAAWKAARSAWKGEGATGKALRYLFMAGAAELAMKEITGRGLIDRSKLFDSMEEAIEGTFKAVLVQRGAEFMQGNDIEAEEHVGALYELDTVPFHWAMKWYQNTNPNGSEREGTDAEAMWKKMRINTNTVLANRKVEWKETDKQLEARRIVKKTMENFFHYAAVKDQYTNTEDGRISLEERWITAVERRDFTQKDAIRTKVLRPEIGERFRGNQNALTWQMVMRSEIDPAHVRETVGSNSRDRIIDYAEGKVWDFLHWGRDTIFGPLKPAAKQFFYGLGMKGELLKEWLVEAGKGGAERLYFTKEKIILWYGANKFEIRRFMGDNLELIKGGLAIPFETMYAAHQTVVPWINTKLRQTREIWRQDTPQHIQSDLSTNLIEDASVTGLRGIERAKKSQNPEFEYYGFYQVPFKKAFEAGSHRADSATGITRLENAFYETQDGIDEDGPMSGIGYYITDVNKEDVGYAQTTDTSDIYNRMEIESRKQATEFFKTKGLTAADIDQYMYKVHRVGKTSKDATTPEKLYIFWRMPLHGSTEYEQKAQGHWPEYWDPNAYKHRPPFVLDPGKSLLENLKNAYGFYHKKPRQIGGWAAKYMSQWIRFLFGTIETSGRIVEGTAHLFKYKNTKWMEAIYKRDEQTMQFIDEMSTGAGNKTLALSEFYSNQSNSDTYKKALDQAHDYGVELNLKYELGSDGKADISKPIKWTNVSAYHGGKTGSVGRINEGFYDGS